MNIAIPVIQQRAQWLGANCEDVLKELLTTYPQFEYWSGSHMQSFHHYGRGGLAQHTMEVIELCFQSRQVLHLEKQIEGETLFYAALFHDTGKMYDYEPLKDADGNLDFNRWESKMHKREIHHISRSALIWNDIIRDHRPDLYALFHENVLHAILSHHGQREWGSPVSPKSKVAWMLHLCDGISARMNDADRRDIVKIAP